MSIVCSHLLSSLPSLHSIIAVSACCDLPLLDVILIFQIRLNMKTILIRETEKNVAEVLKGPSPWTEKLVICEEDEGEAGFEEK